MLVANSSGTTDASKRVTFLLRSMKMSTRKGPSTGRQMYLSKFNKYIEKRVYEKETIDIDDWVKFLKLEKGQFLRRGFRWGKENSLNVSDFVFVKIIGAGATGDVLMSLKIDDDNFYAIKVINKELLLAKNQVNYAKTEKFVLDSVRCPFTIHMEYFFQTDINLYYVLPLVLGIDLFGFLRIVTKLSEDMARFYLAQIVLSLEYLHYLDVVYRDLKPENVVMDNDGYIKLTDFGYSKILKGRTYTICGTPEYMAPELYCHGGYGNSVDWWAFGVVAYELCTGYTPFYAEDATVIGKKVISGLYKIPSYFSVELKDFVGHLLQLDVTKRYGNLKEGPRSIKNHTWFNGTDWNAIIKHTIIPPYKPSLRKFERLYTFDVVEERPASIWVKQNEHLFSGF